jgi:dTDP-4-amino-4,6-dideoxygalactose transaminase
VKFYIPSLPKFEELSPLFTDILQTGQLTKGKYAEEFEKDLENYLKVNHCISVCNATIGLILAIKALGLSKKVILPSFTFISTASSLLWNNIQPIFVDIDISTFNISVLLIEECLKKEKDITGLLIPHTFGNPVNIDNILYLKKKYNLKVIFDSASSLGAEYKNKKIGNFGDCEVFSLTPTKNVIAGEGGVISTNQKGLAEKLKILRNYGDMNNLGLNARLAEFSAILAKKSLLYIEENLKKKERLVKIYKDKLKHIPGITFQQSLEFTRPGYKDFSILINEDKFGMDRDTLALALEKESIPTRKYFYPPLHQQPLFKNSAIINNNLVNTEYVANRILNLPLYPKLTQEEVEHICQTIIRIHESCKK